MQHLTPEALARLVDEEGGPEEVAHLAACPECAAELGAMREQTVRLGELGDLPAPRSGRFRLERALADEGLLVRRRGGRGAALRAAAAAGIFLLGGVAGAAVTGGGGAPPLAVRADEPVEVEQATAALRDAETAYLHAVTRYAELTGAAVGLDPINRLAALEGIVLTTRAALREAPADPVINNYHLTALGQRDALLLQIERASADEWF